MDTVKENDLVKHAEHVDRHIEEMRMTEIVSIRLSEQEKEKYIALAKLMGLSLSSLIRNLLEDEYFNKTNAFRKQ